MKRTIAIVSLFLAFGLSACGGDSTSSSLLDAPLSPLGRWEQQSRNGIVERIEIAQTGSTWFRSVPNLGTATTSVNLLTDSSTAPGHMTFTVTNISVTGQLSPEFRVGDVFRCNFKVESFPDGQWFSRQCGSANAPSFPTSGAWKGYKKSN